MRWQRAQLKRDLRAGVCSLEELLRDPPGFLSTAKVAGLLLALPKHGPVKVDKLLRRCRIAPSKTVGGLSQRQRDELAALLADEPQAAQRNYLAGAPTGGRPVAEEGARAAATTLDRR